VHLHHLHYSHESTRLGECIVRMFVGVLSMCSACVCVGVRACVLLCIFTVLCLSHDVTRLGE